MPDLVCPFCAKIDCTSEYNLKRHVAACSKRFTAYDDDESVNESDKKIPRFASLKNDDDYESDNNNHMPMEEDDDAYIENFNSDNERDSNVGIIGDENSDDESSNRTLNDDSSTICNDEEEEEQYDFDEWFEEQKNIHENRSEKSNDKEDNFVKFLDNITSNSLMDYENEMTKKTQHLPPIPPEMQDAIQLLSLLNTSKASFSLYEKIVKWRQSCKSAIEDKKMPTRKEVLKFLTNRYKVSGLMPQKKPCTLPSIGLDIDVPVHPFLGCIYSLLTSPELMKSDNLIFKDLENLSYVPPLDDYKCYDEVDSGTAYHLFQQKIAEKENAVQIPLIFFSDGTVVDKAGRHSFEPFMFTLGIFKQSLRTKPMAWRNLGFTRGNPKTKFSNADKERGKQNVHKYGQKDPRHVPDNHRDFHAQVRTLLQELLLIQELEDGIRWQFTIDGVKQGKVYHLFFQFYFHG